MASDLPFSTRREGLSVHAAGRRLHAERIVPERALGPESLVFLHEGLGAGPSWRDVPDELCARLGRPGLVYDRWGYGASEPFDRPRTERYLHDEALEALPELLAEAGTIAPVLVGHSDGGSIALLYAAAFPERPRVVVSIAAHVFVEPLTIAGIEAAVSSWEGGTLRRSLARLHGAQAERVFHAWADTWLAPGFASWNIERDIAGIAAPLLLVQGTDDQYGTDRQLDAIAAAARGPVEIAVIPDCGHVPHLQAREATLARITHFLDAHLSGTAVDRGGSAA